MIIRVDEGSREVGITCSPLEFSLIRGMFVRLCGMLVEHRNSMSGGFSIEESISLGFAQGFLDLCEEAGIGGEEKSCR